MNQPRPKSKWGWQKVVFAPDGKRYATHTGLEARVYDTATGFEPVRLDDQTDKISAGTTGGVTSRELVWSPDGKKVAAVGVQVQGQLGGAAMGAAVWDAETGNRLHVFGSNLDVPQTLTFSADGKLLAATFKDRVVLYDAKTFKEVRNLGDHQSATALAFSPDGKRLAAGIRLPIRAGDDVRKWSYHTQVRLIDTETGKTVKAFDGFEGKDHPTEATKLPVTALAFSADGKKLIAGTGLTSVVPVYWGVVAHPNDLPKAGEVKVWSLDKADAPPPIKPDP